MSIDAPYIPDDPESEEEAALIPVNEQGNEGMTIANFSEVFAAVISREQFIILSGHTPKEIIRHRPGKGGKIFSYIPHGYVTKQLNLAFGFDWDFEPLPMGDGNFYQYIPGSKGTTNDGKPLNHPGAILVHGRLTVRIRDPKDPSRVIATIVKQATGEKEETNGMTWGGMIKSAESDAFKKCATRLGVGNDLYYQDTQQDYIESTPALASVLLTSEQVQYARDQVKEGKKPAAIAKELGIEPAQLFDAVPGLMG